MGHSTAWIMDHKSLVLEHIYSGYTQTNKLTNKHLFATYCSNLLSYEDCATDRQISLSFSSKLKKAPTLLPHLHFLSLTNCCICCVE